MYTSKTNNLEFGG